MASSPNTASSRSAAASSASLRSALPATAGAPPARHRGTAAPRCAASRRCGSARPWPRAPAPRLRPPRSRVMRKSAGSGRPVGKNTAVRNCGSPSKLDVLQAVAHARGRGGIAGAEVDADSHGRGGKPARGPAILRACRRCVRPGAGQSWRFTGGRGPISLPGGRPGPGSAVPGWRIRRRPGRSHASRAHPTGHRRPHLPPAGPARRPG